MFPYKQEIAIRLRIIERDKQPIEFSTSLSEIVLGRSPDCDVVVNHPYVSGRHLRILAGVVVEDLGSSNGTFLDDSRIETPSLMGGRRLTVGGPVIRVEIDGAPSMGAAAAGEDASDASQGEVDRLKARVAELERQLAGAGGSGATSPAAALLEDLVAEDFGNFETRLEGPVDEFYLVESFRMLRLSEKAISYMATELTKKLSMHTALPDSDGNLVRLLAEVLAQPGEPGPRRDFADHLSEVRRWMNVILSVYQKASVQFTDEMRASLSPMTLAQEGPIAAPIRWLRQEEKVLWRRARTYLDGLTPEGIHDRLDELAKACAKKMLN